MNVLLLMYVYIYKYIELKARIRDCFTPTPHVCQLETVYNIKSWISPVIKEIHGHSVPLCFKFQASIDEAELHTKRWTTSEWQTHGGLLKVIIICLCQREVHLHLYSLHAQL